jgi:hypothetical protein
MLCNVNAEIALGPIALEPSADACRRTSSRNEMSDRILQANGAGANLPQRPCGTTVVLVDRFHIALDLQIEPRPSTFRSVKVFLFLLSLHTSIEHRVDWFVR